MKYNTPQITRLGDAVRAIESTDKEGTHTDVSRNPTACAYEADE